ncbi:unnamed protein product [Moneuplotes crassus]|uniref:Uncharacterized protein n=1 Tax=Euplotes crassus TaxID=5936 RepID=A0AAD1U1G8_EUPCR|nr:unnamed protein product [Moneuplotes crassus]
METCETIVHTIIIHIIIHCLILKLCCYFHKIFPKDVPDCFSLKENSESLVQPEVSPIVICD